MTRIQFGTSGWRGVIADDFTLPRALAVVQGIADHLRAAGLEGRGIVVGYDTRFLSERFAGEAAKLLATNGIRVFLCERDTPTPVVACEIRRRQAGGGITITASHNPPEWNGIKFSTAAGGPAPPEVTRYIEAQANARLPNAQAETIEIGAAEKAGLLTMIDPFPPYLTHLQSLVDYEAIRRARLRVVVDPLFGTGRGVLDAACREAGCEVEMLHDWRDPLFGGGPPDPAPTRLQDLAQRVVKRRAHLGLATDGDADRFGIVDNDGTVPSANQILALLFKHLLSTRPPGGVARTVATTHLLDAVARHYHVPVYETPVGFKYLGELLLQEKVILAGEESAGLSIRGHIPEKDGVLACLLVAEMVAHRGRASLKELLDELYAQVGTILSRRIDFTLKPEERARLLTKLEEPPRELIGRRVAAVERKDGTKLLLEDGSWLLIRPSGTEPVVRLYVEAQNARDLEGLIEASRKLVYSA